jgi:hypothetical protein
MSMSEFERELNSGESGSSSLSTHSPDIPADFSEEDLEFVQELNALFAPEEEALPPYFVQTLLEPDEPRFRPVERGFEHKTSARVFRRLKLRRRLFRSRPDSLDVILSATKDLPARRSLLALTAMLLLFMMVTVAFTSPSFAEGLEILLHGARSGVYQVNNYPSAVHHSIPKNNTLYRPREISLSAAQNQLMHFRIYWPTSMPQNYSLTGIYLYPQVDQNWFDGPIIDLAYNYSSPGVVPQGTGQIIIREFKPQEDMLQVVQTGSAYPLEVDKAGRARAIYVNGQWARYTHQWIKGQRSELIYQQNGVVFWIVGDQRDGITKDVLMQIAQSLQVVNLSKTMLVRNDIDYMVELVNNLPGPFANDVIWIDPDNSSDPPYMATIGNDQPLPEKPVKTVTRMQKSS